MQIRLKSIKNIAILMVSQSPGHKNDDGVKPLLHKTVHPVVHSLPPILKGRVLHLGSKNL
jgi:hypothetical protein